MTTALQRLLKYPHSAVFDKDPDGDLALRVRHSDGASWAIADEVLTVTAGDVERSYDLSEFTIGGLANALRADGFDVPVIGDGWASRSALVLCEGTGNQYASNGDHVLAFRSLLWALLTGYAGEVRVAEHQVREALRQMVMTQAEGEWLDLWGALYGVERRPSEADPAYRVHIPQEAFRLRVSPGGIEKSILDATGKDVRIYEPWKNIFTLDVSRLSKGDHLYDGEYYGYHIIQPRAKTSIDWSDVLPVVERNRAAGVLQAPPYVEFVIPVDATVNGSIGVGVMSTFGHFVPFYGEGRLDYMTLDGENEYTLNWPVMSSQLISLSNQDGLAGLGNPSDGQAFAKASVVLSDSPPLGDQNAILSGRSQYVAGTPITVDDELQLDGYQHLESTAPVDEVFTSISFFAVSFGDNYDAGMVGLCELNSVSANAEDLRVSADWVMSERVGSGAIADTPVSVHAVGYTVTGTWLEGGWDSRTWGSRIL